MSDKDRADAPRSRYSSTYPVRVRRTGCPALGAPGPYVRRASLCLERDLLQGNGLVPGQSSPLALFVAEADVSGRHLDLAATLRGRAASRQLGERFATTSGWSNEKDHVVGVPEGADKSTAIDGVSCNAGQLGIDRSSYAGGREHDTRGYSSVG